jgi:hypothetical protein
MIREEAQTHLISSGIRNEKRSVFLKNTAFPLVEKQASFFRKKNCSNHFVITENFSSVHPVLFIVIRQIL